MQTSITRSLPGATHVPFRRNVVSAGEGVVASSVLPRLDDPFEENGKVTIKADTARPFAKARLLAKLCDNPKTAAVMTARYREIYLNVPGDPRSEEREIQTGLLKVIEKYAETRRYRSLVAAMSNVSSKHLLNVVRNWLNIEQRVLSDALSDWRTTAREIAAEEKSEAAKEIAAGIAQAQTQITAEYDRLATEVAKLETRLGSKQVAPSKLNATEVGANNTAFAVKGNGWSLNGTDAKPFVITAPRAKAWNRLWQSKDRQASARFLAAYLMPGKNLGYSLLQMVGKAAPDENVLEITDMALLAGVKELDTARRKDIGAMVKELAIEPVGVLYLERLDFTPVGNVRGELVYTLPLTPGEKTTVSHTEWSHTAEEYVSEVEEEFEQQMEKEVSESTELTESSKSETEVSHKASAELKVGMESGSWTFEASGGYDYENCKNNAVESAMKRDREMTHKASSRSKEQHKLTFSISRERRVEDAQVREIANTSDQPVRWDFYRLMKKWQIDLYHIGERLTYEVMVPEPGHYLLRKYVEMKALQDRIDAGDPFDLGVDALSRDNWEQLAGEWGADLTPPPASELRDLYFEDFVEYPGHQASGYKTLEIELPEGYAFARVENRTELRNAVCGETTTEGGRVLDIGANWNEYFDRNARQIPFNARRFAWLWYYHFDEGANCATPRIQLHVIAGLTSDGYRKWRVESWNRLREAARVKWIATLEGLQSRRDRLMAELFGKDSLKLRQIEQEEIMKGVLCWMLGPDFEFYPDLLQILHEHLRNRLAEEAQTAGTLPPALDPLGYYDEETQRLLGTWYQDIVAEYGDMIRFIHQAVEWENVKWILYPYFWTFPGRWDFKQAMEHPDFYHRSFLRAGSSRVIIPIRPGFENAWIEFTEGKLPTGHPYLTLAEEIQARAETNYAYTPDPNREALQEEGEHIDRWFEYTPTGALHVEQGETPADA
ncbi:MAG: hypothetical protein JST85_28850 [Acidobacteria bacterium]|nr:hypothetical protein [Acidobacteriota bacterium]